MRLKISYFFARVRQGLHLILRTNKNTTKALSISYFDLIGSIMPRVMVRYSDLAARLIDRTHEDPTPIFDLITAVERVAKQYAPDVRDFLREMEEVEEDPEVAAAFNRFLSRMDAVFLEHNNTSNTRNH